VPVRTSSYRLHKPAGQDVVTRCGRDLYLGKYGTPESRSEYDRLINERGLLMVRDELPALVLGLNQSKGGRGKNHS
jgi:hypothetical protein